MELGFFTMPFGTVPETTPTHRRGRHHRQVGDTGSGPRMLDLMKTGEEMSDSDVTLEYLVDNIGVVGSPDEVVEKLGQLYEDVGGFGVLLAMGHEWKPKEPWLNSMRLLKEEAAVYACAVRDRPKPRYASHTPPSPSKRVLGSGTEAAAP